jgi:hypothetical protein
MRKKLTLTVDEQPVYDGPHAVVREDLDVAYRQMAADEAREAEAREWAEATVGDMTAEAP